MRWRYTKFPGNPLPLRFTEFDSDAGYQPSPRRSAWTLGLGLLTLRAGIAHSSLHALHGLADRSNSVMLAMIPQNPIRRPCGVVISSESVPVETNAIPSASNPLASEFTRWL